MYNHRIAAISSRVDAVIGIKVKLKTRVESDRGWRSEVVCLGRRVRYRRDESDRAEQCSRRLDSCCVAQVSRNSPCRQRIVELGLGGARGRSNQLASYIRI